MKLEEGPYLVQFNKDSRVEGDEPFIAYYEPANNMWSKPSWRLFGDDGHYMISILEPLKRVACDLPNE